jgi:hypothetical protein
MAVPVSLTRIGWRRGTALAVAALLVGVPGALTGTAPAQADASPWVVTGPAGSAGPTASVRYDTAEGRVSLAVSRGGQTVLEPGPVGIVTEQVDLSKDLRPLGRTNRTIFEAYTATVGKRLNRVVRMKESRFAFAGNGGARVDLVVRVSADGVAYRYDLPQNRSPVLAEASAFVVPAASPAWLGLYRRDYENPYIQMTAGGAATAEYMFPALFESGGSYVLLTESDVDGRYSAARLTHESGSGTYRVKLWDEKVQVDGPLVTPWRTMIVGDLATIAESTLADDLAPPSRVADTSWIEPGKVFWSWLAGGREAGQSLKTQKSYVDYAASHGWPFVLVDAGWNLDPYWDPDPTWETTSWIPELVRYAEARRVKVMTWIHYTDLDTAEERARRLPLLARWGVVGLKIDFMDSDAQERFRWYDEILPETAQHKLLVNFHGSTLPHGIHRTWPHVMTMEAVHGGEKSSNLPITHLASLPFTRNVVGSMDYTPMAWHRPSRPTSDAHELALAVIFESGHQNFAGRIDGYAARPQAERFLDQVPTVWDQTRLLAGRPADGSVFARRSGGRWFLGGGFAGPPRTVRAPLDLPAGQWLVEIINDSPAGLVREQRVMTAGDTLAVGVAKDGGFAGLACRWSPGVTTCDKPVKVMPTTTTAVAPAKASVVPGGSYTVTGEFTAAETVRDVVLQPRVPTGWSFRGTPVRAERVRPGQKLTGTWTVTAPENPTFGYLDVPVVAEFRYREGPDGLRYGESEKPVAVHVWRPLPAGWRYLSDAPFLSETNGLGPVERDTTNGPAGAADGRGISVRQRTYGKGLGAFAVSEVSVALDGRCKAFVADVGLDDEAALDIARTRLGGTVAFAVAGDGVALAATPTMGIKDQARTLSVDVTGVKILTLRVTDGGDGTQNDRASWADARVHCAN